MRGGRTRWSALAIRSIAALTLIGLMTACNLGGEQSNQDPVIPPEPAAIETAQPPDRVPNATAAASESPIAESDQFAGAASGPLTLFDRLDEPEGYCVDVVGFGASLQLGSALQAHTCKLNGSDQLLSFDTPGPGQIQLTDFDLCLTVDEISSSLLATACRQDDQSQRFQSLPTGQITTADGAWCLVVDGGRGRPVGGPSHLRRDLNMARCSEAAVEVSAWTLPVGP